MKLNELQEMSNTLKQKRIFFEKERELAYNIKNNKEIEEDYYNSFIVSELYYYFVFKIIPKCLQNKIYFSSGKKNDFELEFKTYRINYQGEKRDKLIMSYNSRCSIGDMLFYYLDMRLTLDLTLHCMFQEKLKYKFFKKNIEYKINDNGVKQLTIVSSPEEIIEFVSNEMIAYQSELGYSSEKFDNYMENLTAECLIKKYKRNKY